MSCCQKGQALKKEYENAIRFEALSYGRLIAHKRRHEQVEEGGPRLHHMRMVNEAARRYAEGDVETPYEIPPAS